MLERLPDTAQRRIIEQLDALELAPGAERECAAQLLAASRFIAAWARREPAAFAALLAAQFAPPPPAQPPADEPTALDPWLRRARNAEMVRLAARQALGWDSPEQTVHGLSAMADHLVGIALDAHWARLCAQKGTPKAASGKRIRPLVFALGKLGGRELNFSSDIDLVIAHSAPGGTEQTSIEEFMARLVQRLTRSLSEAQSEGFVFRVDLRLRPFGSQGAPSLSLSALDAYFEAHARDWERYAWQKARCIAGAKRLGEAWLETLRPFIYRRYIDFGQLAGLRRMKDEIDADVRARGREQDIKRGWGGIREMEFAVQALQLIHGGARPSLQQRSFIRALEALRTEGLVEPDFAARWREHYWFLRQVENTWQALDDAQSHVLPSDEEPRQRLLVGLRIADWASFEEALSEVRRRVRAHFLELFTPTEDAALPPPAQALLAALQSESPQWPAPFAEHAEALTDLARSAQRMLRAPADREALLTLAVRLLDAAPDALALQRLLVLSAEIAGRPNYVTMLREHGEARRELVQLCARSGFIAAELTRHPALLVELCQPESLYAPPSRSSLRRHIARQLAACDDGDIEDSLEQLRRIKHATALRIAAADAAHALPLMRVSDHLSELAEEIVGGALAIAVAQMRERWPQLGAMNFAVVAYGKLGGLELSYSSDLDLVFVYKDAQIEGVDREPQEFYTRLVQKLINALATRTGAGRCYEVDTRLRPNGNAGLLVTSLAAFARYQRESAWTWEQQALVRARPIWGSETVQAEFAAQRAEVLQRRREPEALRGEIVEMRAKMARELSQGPDYDPKHAPGGLVDIEFYAQWLVLAHASEHPALVRYSDLLRIVEAAADVELITPELSRALGQRYRALREYNHAQALQMPPPEPPAAGAATAELDRFFGRD